MNKKVALLAFSSLLLSTVSLNINVEKAVAGNRMQNAIAEARSLAAKCQSSSSCSDCVRSTVIPQIQSKYRISSRREIEQITAAALGSCQ